MNDLGPRIDALRKRDQECIEVIDELVRMLDQTKTALVQVVGMAYAGVGDKKTWLELANDAVNGSTLYP